MAQIRDRLIGYCVSHGIAGKALLAMSKECDRLTAINAEMAEALEVAASALRGVVMSYRDAPQQFTEPLRQVRAALDKSRT